MKRSAVSCLLSWLLALALLFSSAAADTLSRLEYPYGFIAELNLEQGEELSVLYDEHTYFFTEGIASFAPSLPMEGKQVLSLFEYTYPQNLQARANRPGQFILGRFHLQGFNSWELIIGEGDRENGYYMFSDPIALSGPFDQDILLEKDAAYRPCRVDRLYLFRSGDTYGAAALYLNYENHGGAEPSIMETIQKQLILLSGGELKPPYPSILSSEVDAPLGSILLSTNAPFSEENFSRDMGILSFQE